MSIFNLPDLGEGLPDAEIHEWLVNEGDAVKTDEPLVSMETAKAVVEVPSPQDGIIEKFYGKPGDIIKTGQPLVSFKAEHVQEVRKDSGTVVGNLEQSDDIAEDVFTIGNVATQNKSRIKATIMVRNLAKKLGVQLSDIKGSGEHGIITKEDVEKASKNPASTLEGYEPLHGTKRAMLQSMTKSHAQVVPVSIFDDADVNHWDKDTDITVRLIRALQKAAKVEPALNAWFDTDSSAVKLFDTLHLGLAMDSGAGLFVPVIHNSDDKSDAELREIIINYKKEVADRTVPGENLKGANFTLSNFGKFAGKYASPIIVPPMVAILAVGKMYEAPVVEDGTVVSHKLLPLSLTFDHRGVTGGEATRFLGEVIKILQQ